MSDFLSSTVGKKYLMGISGLVWAGFVLAHMAGNLFMFLSADAYNSYGHAITSGYLIYAVEVVLILALITHVYCAVSLTLHNKASRPEKYAVSASGKKRVSLASRTMGVQGSVVLAFIILHIATFKYGTYYETTVHGVVMRDLFKLITEVFHKPGYVVWYLVALVLLGFHLSHGVKSSFQSLGLMNGTYRPIIQAISYAYAIIVAAGFISQPIFVYFFAA